MLNLPAPQFINVNPEQVRQEMQVLYEQITGKTLYPAQPEALMLDVLAYRETVLRDAFQWAAQQNLIQYATGEILEKHALLFGVTRQGALKAKTVLRFTADAASPIAITIPASTQIRSKDGKVTFVTLTSISIELSETYKDVDAEALNAGAAANDYPVGSITETLTTIAFLDNVQNTVLTHSGANVESDEQLRSRVMQAPETFSVAGSRGAYLFWAFSAHPSIIDVSVDSNLPGTVQVYPLVIGGTPSPIVIADVDDVLSDERVRPLTDKVTVIAPTQKTFTIDVNVTLYSIAPSVEVKAQIETKLAEYTATLRQKLGRDIVPNQIISIIQSVSGVYNVNLQQPAELEPVERNEYADCTAITVTLLPATNEQPLTT